MNGEIRSIRRPSVAAWTLWLCIGAGAPAALAETIIFEEPIAAPETVVLQYCNLGVEFLDTQRIFAPPLGTFSAPNALTNDFPGDELGEYDELRIRFTTGQSAVGMNVGLHQAYNTPGSGLIAELLAYSSATPGLGLLDSNSWYLGDQPTAITRGPLSVASAAGDIRSVLLRVWEPQPSQYPGFETIDNLTFDAIGPPCGNDSGPPSVTIVEPAVDGVEINTSKMLLGFDAADDLRLASVEVEFLDAADALLDSFYSCGGDRLPCPSNTTYSRTFWTFAPVGTARIRVTATDFFSNSASDDRMVDLVLPGPQMNLWAESMEITQATQPWLPVNFATRAAAVPTFAYPDPASSAEALPLVAGRTTVVRLTAGAEDLGQASSVAGVPARLRCFTNAGFDLPCPGPAGIVAEHRPGKSAQQVTIVADDTLAAKRRDTLKTWNFVLPHDWVSQAPTGDDSFSLFLEAQVYAPAGLEECPGCDDAANRIRVASVRVFQVPSFSDELVRTAILEEYNPASDTVHRPEQSLVDSQVDFIRRVFPVDDSTVSPVTELFSTTTPVYPILGTRDCLYLTDIETIFPAAEDGECCLDGRRALLYFQSISDETCGLGWGTGGWANPRLYPGIREHYAAAYLARLNGIQTHAPRGRLHPPHTVTDWPWPGGSTGAFGFDIVGFDVIPMPVECESPGVCSDEIDNDGDGRIDEDCPGSGGLDLGASPEDFRDGALANCDVSVSSRSWVRIFNVFTDRQLPYLVGGSADGSSGSSAAASSTGSDSQGIGGGVAPDVRVGAGESDSPAFGGGTTPALQLGAAEAVDGSWQLGPAFELEAPGSLPVDGGSGAYRVELLDAAGQLVAGRNVEAVAPLEPSPDTPPVAPEPTRLRATLPVPAAVQTIALQRDGELLALRSRSASAPTLQLISPTAAGFVGQPSAPRVEWIADDADGDRLSFIVQYLRSAGDVWRTIGSLSDGEQLDVDLETLEGSSDARVRVQVSDGFNTTSVTSNPFFVAGKSPRAELRSPPDGLILPHRARLVARGAGFDLEDGTLPATDLDWSSDLDGWLGQGRDLDLSLLSPGVHELSLTATDSDGQSASTSIAVEIAEPINGQPLADAGPDRTVASDELLGLSGGESTDVDGDPLGFAWTVVAQPAGGDATLSSPEAMDTTFIATVYGDYTIGLVVDDGQVESVQDTLVVTVCGTEINDGQDNGCPGQPGQGLVDELSDPVRFLEPDQLSWTSQDGATLYQVARSTSPDMSTDCTTFTTSSTSLIDLEDPAPGAAFHYLARPVQPFEGSWGAGSDGNERTFVCGGETVCDDGVDDDDDGLFDCADPDCPGDWPCLAELTFQDTGADELDSSSLRRFFQDAPAEPADYILFEIEIGGQPRFGLCSRRADFYRDNYLSLAANGGSVTSGAWTRWFRTGPNGIWQADSPLSFNTNGHGVACGGQAYAWCPEREALRASIHPLETGTCEAITTQCGDGSWVARLRISPLRVLACGF